MFTGRQRDESAPTATVSQPLIHAAAPMVPRPSFLSSSRRFRYADSGVRSRSGRSQGLGLGSSSGSSGSTVRKIRNRQSMRPRAAMLHRAVTLSPSARPTARAGSWWRTRGSGRCEAGRPPRAENPPAPGRIPCSSDSRASRSSGRSRTRPNPPAAPRRPRPTTASWSRSPARRGPWPDGPPRWPGPSAHSDRSPPRPGPPGSRRGRRSSGADLSDAGDRRAELRGRRGPHADLVAGDPGLRIARATRTSVSPSDRPIAARSSYDDAW